jgi:CheY-like chemotaxis protein
MVTPCILVVDDEPLNIEILTDSLEYAGYETVTARDGAEAWALLTDNPERFDAVLLDRMMPRMNGIEVLKRMRASPPHAIVPVILQSARAAKEDIVEGLQAGAIVSVVGDGTSDATPCGNKRKTFVASLRVAVGSPTPSFRRSRALRVAW